MELFEKLEKVNSKEKFLEFVGALVADKIDEDVKEAKNPSAPFSEDANGWQNGTITDFLESAHAYSVDSGKLDLSWKSFATFLYAGKIYE